jgi:hypothetical protein
LPTKLVDKLNVLIFIEHYFNPYLSQSKIDGRQGSSACTIIAALTAHKVLSGILALPNSKRAHPPTEVLEMFIACIRQGNHVYDSSNLKGLLTIDEALEALSAISIRI